MNTHWNLSICYFPNLRFHSAQVLSTLSSDEFTPESPVCFHYHLITDSALCLADTKLTIQNSHPAKVPKHHFQWEQISLWQALVFCGKWFVKGDFIIVQWVNIKLYVNLSFYFRKVWIGISALMVHLLFEKFHQTFFSFGRMRELFCMINSMQHDIDVFFVRPYIAILIPNFTWSGYSLWHANFENITKWNKVFLFHSLQ